ncbi:hypothetical protein CDAR_284021 [Caerostris darwini]|uniref:Uncharacterized protein n=1 Tax=Caerostris darwini TaxID=1538125 RepID=A0AAV4PLU7_9ARAC|nr:hypothetical protein CDAR_284021 [Caerostris darwini]
MILVPPDQSDTCLESTATLFLNEWIIAGLKLPLQAQKLGEWLWSEWTTWKGPSPPHSSKGLSSLPPPETKWGRDKSWNVDKEQKSLAIRANHNHRLFPSLQLNSLHQFIQTYSICVPSVT